MDELRSILDTWFSLEGENQDAVLATVVHVKGSAYRRPGARMLLIPDGRRIGSISGGCLEGEISRKAWWFTAGGSPVVRVYDTTSDDDAVWEFGLGCNGIVQVMLERADSPSARAFFQFLSQNPSAQPAVVATVVRSTIVAAGERFFLNGEGPLAGSRQIRMQPRPPTSRRCEQLASVIGRSLKPLCSSRSG